MSTRISVTDTARQELERLVTAGGVIRLGIDQGGCAGMRYRLLVVPEPEPHDITIYERAPVRVVADAGESIYLDEVRIDYSGDLLDHGFKFLNPRAERSCACGASFSLEG